MSSTQTILIAAVAGVAIVSGAAWLKQDDLKAWVGGGGIHSVDFRNAPVEVVGTACADPQLITAGVTNVPLHDGTYQLGQYQFELVGDVRYGDVSGHTGESGSDKAVFVGSCSTSGKTSQVLFVYGMEDGKPARIASTDLSGSANSLVQSYNVGDGAIQIKANQGEPPTLVTLSYALLNRNLVNLNPSSATQGAQAPETTPTADAAQTPETSAAAPADESAENTGAGEDKVSFESFHDELAPYGNWIQHPRWGTVWHPTAVPTGFRPYRDGHWENTDEYGTVWVSDYGWGDVPFHYGRWGYDPNYGWLWTPGYVWSPAWVAWRQGAGNIGWLPIPPGEYDGEGAYADDWDSWYGYRALYGAALDEAAFDALWSFVPADDIYAPSIGVDVIAPALYVGFIGRTAGWTRFDRFHGHLFNRAIDGGRFRAAFGHPLRLGTRHDFLGHHGPIVGVDRGRRIEAVQRTHSTASLGHGIAAHRAASGPNRTGAHEGDVRRASHTSYAYSRSGTHARTNGEARSYSRSAGMNSRAGGAYSRSRGVEPYSRSGGYSRSTSAGPYSRSGAGGFPRTGSGGYPRTGSGGYPGGLGAQHKEGFAGAGFQQRPMNGGGGFGGGGFAPHPVNTGGGVAHPAPQIQRPAQSNNQRHH